MPLNLEYGDITKIHADAIVNAANSSLLGGGGVDGAIHAAAGEGLLKECMTLGGCRTGEAKITGGYKLPAKYVIHTVGPVWQGGNCGEEKLLRSCYRNSIEIALKKGLRSIAFPLISSGVYGYPVKQAFFVACDEIADAIAGEDIEATLVLYDKPSLSDDAILRRRLDESPAILNNCQMPSGSSPLMMQQCASMAPLPDNAAPAKKSKKRTHLFESKKKENRNEKSDAVCGSSEEHYYPDETDSESILWCEDGMLPDSDFPENLFINADESFSDYLFRLIDAKGLTDPECYKKANISRKLFSKIRCDRDYRPEKKTVLAFAVALELNLDETKALLEKAGFAFSDWNKFDIIVSYYISKGVYDIFTINETLFEYDQLLLGSATK